MPNNIFSVPIFIIVLRETIEAAIIVSVLLGLVENLVAQGGNAAVDGTVEDSEDTIAQRQKFLIRKMRIQIWAGTFAGLGCALAIGAAFIAVFFTTLDDIWSKSEEIWEGTFSLVACIIIFVMGLTMLRIDRSKVKWQQKLEGAFNEKVALKESGLDRTEGKGGKWALFLLPAITVLREGLEAVVFVGGVSLGQSAKSIPLAAIVGLICGLIIGYLIYASSSHLNLTIFLIVSTNILFLLGAGLFSKAVGDFERYKFNQGVGLDVAELGSGPGSFDVRGNVWHLDYGNPELNTATDGYSIFNAILGWSNNASYGTILSYVFYWVACILCVIYMKFQEGRTKLFGRESAAGRRVRIRKETKASRDASTEDLDSKEKKELGSEESGEEVPVADFTSSPIVV